MATVKIANRYRIIETLGEGALGIVYRAVDQGSTWDLSQDGGPEVALKVLKRRINTVATRLKFKQEYRAMAQLRHPRIVSVHDYGILRDGRPYISMELVGGTSLAGDCPMPWERVVRLLAQLLEALAFLHQSGLLHRDIKLENLRCTDDQLTLIDFGLLERIGTRADTGVTGSPAHVAPETIRGGILVAATDLYAVGILAHYMLTGSFPFVGTIGDVLHAHLTLAPPPLGDTVPPALQRVVGELLCKDPAGRYQSAERVRQDLVAMLPDLATAHSNEVLAMVCGSTIGRQQELSLLDRALGDVVQGRGRTVLIGAPAGTGKSRVLQEFKVRCQLAGHAVIAVTCPSGGHATPNLVHVLHQLIPWAAAGLIDAYGPALVRLVPGLAERGITALEALPDPLSEKARLLEAFVAVLQGTARITPLILLVDDLHWADSLTLEALTYCLTELRQSAVLLVGAYRSDEITPGHALQRAIADGLAYDLHLQPLDGTGIAELVRGMVGRIDLPEQFLTQLSTVSGGNPFFVTELLRHLVEMDLLRYGTDGWQVPKNLPVDALPASVATTILGRAERLTRDAQQLVALASVMGRTITLEPLQAASGLSESALLDALDELLERQLLHYADDALAFLHERVRESLYEALTQTERRRLHQRLAEAWDAIDADVGVLAYHYSRGTDHTRAFRHLVAAGKQAESIGIIREAYHYWRQAYELVCSVPGVARPEQHLALLLDLGIKCGFSVNPDLGEVVLEQAIERLEAKLDCKRLMRVSAVVARIATRLPGPLRLAAERLLADVPAWRTGRWQDPRAVVGKLLESYTWLAICCNSNGKITKALATSQRALELVPDDTSWAWGVVMTAHCYSRVLQGHIVDSVQLVRQAFDRVKDIRLPTVVSLSCGQLVLANNQVFLGLPIDRDYQAELARRCAGMPEWEGMVHYCEMVTYALSGRHKACMTAIELALQHSRKCGQGTVLEREIYLALARIQTTCGKFDEALKAIQYGISLDGVIRLPYFTSRYHEIWGRVCLEQGQDDEAERHFQQVLSMERSFGIAFTVPEALIGLSEVARRRRQWPAAAALAGEALAMAMAPDTAARIKEIYACRQLGLIASDRLAVSAARTYLEQALTIARELDNPWQEALTLLALLPGCHDDPVRAAQLQQQAETCISGQANPYLQARLTAWQDHGPRRRPVSLDSLQAFIQQAASGLQPAQLYTLLIEQAVTVLQAQQAILVDGTGHDVLAFWSRDTAGGDVEAMRRRAQAAPPSGEPLPPDGLINLPIEGGGGRLGLLCLTGIGPAAREQVPIVVAMARFSGILLANAVLVAEAEAKSQRLQMLNHLGKVVASALDLDSMLDALLEQVITLTQAERAVVILSEGGQPSCRRWRGTPGGISMTSVLRVFATREPLCLLDVESGGESISHSVLAMGVKSVMCVPLIAQDELLGAIHVSSQATAKTFAPLDLELFNAIANQTAISVRNARQLIEIEERQKLRQELEIAHRIQQGFFPQDMPRMAGIDLAGTCQPALEVGGDFYDVIRMDDGRLALFVGDVSGKNISAALYMAVARTAIRIAVKSAASPACC
ncbi:MAG: protein kinase, partial [Candidatus Sericytochromatia bacterium]|nr:protein kinase [Candidatus Sericytochromatia bacterium]